MPKMPRHRGSLPESSCSPAVANTQSSAGSRKPPTRAASISRALEATTGFEPVMGVLQTPALPLGYVALGARPPVRLAGRPDNKHPPGGPGGRVGFISLVPRRRFELLRLAARPPQDRVSAYSTTSARGCVDSAHQYRTS